MKLATCLFRVAETEENLDFLEEYNWLSLMNFHLERVKVELNDDENEINPNEVYMVRFGNTVIDDIPGEFLELLIHVPMEPDGNIYYTGK